MQKGQFYQVETSGKSLVPLYVDEFYENFGIFFKWTAKMCILIYCAAFLCVWNGKRVGWDNK